MPERDGLVPEGWVRESRMDLSRVTGKPELIPADTISPLLPVGRLFDRSSVRADPFWELFSDPLNFRSPNREFHRKSDASALPQLR
jgi:hypothetical protein